MDGDDSHEQLGMSERATLILPQGKAQLAASDFSPSQRAAARATAVREAIDTLKSGLEPGHRTPPH
jgi:hypothetical protein